MTNSTVILSPSCQTQLSMQSGSGRVSCVVLLAVALLVIPLVVALLAMLLAEVILELAVWCCIHRPCGSCHPSPLSFSFHGPPFPPFPSMRWRRSFFLKKPSCQNHPCLSVLLGFSPVCQPFRSCRIHCSFRSCRIRQRFRSCQIYRSF